MGWVKCTDCGRVLQIQNGTVCPDCLTKRQEAQAQKPIVKRGRKPKEEPHG